MDQTLTPAQQRARLHQLLDTLPDAAVAAWLQLLDAAGTPTTAPAPRGEAPPAPLTTPPPCINRSTLRSPPTWCSLTRHRRCLRHAPI